MCGGSARLRLRLSLDLNDPEVAMPRSRRLLTAPVAATATTPVAATDADL